MRAAARRKKLNLSRATGPRSFYSMDTNRSTTEFLRTVALRPISHKNSVSYVPVLLAEAELPSLRVTHQSRAKPHHLMLRLALPSSADRPPPVSHAFPPLLASRCTLGPSLLAMSTPVDTAAPDAFARKTEAESAAEYFRSPPPPPLPPLPLLLARRPHP
jgi:hypothetical protein